MPKRVVVASPSVGSSAKSTPKPILKVIPRVGGPEILPERTNGSPCGRVVRPARCSHKEFEKDTYIRERLLPRGYLWMEIMRMILDNTADEGGRSLESLAEDATTGDDRFAET